MKRSNLIAVLVILIVIGAVGAYFLTKDSSNQDSASNASSSEQAPSQNTPESTSTDNQSTQEQSQGSNVYSKEEVSKHSTSSDCWTIINKKVYNLTPYVSRHSGGNEILRACGIDGTTLFTQRETADGESVGTGTPHSATAQSDLNSLQIGTLAD